jgi:Cof subfamily protein (haloacid dehalogenase superfamily)
MEIKAVMCDLDGTLLNEKSLVTAHTAETIRRIKEKGFFFGLSTGRDAESVQNLARDKWKIDSLVDGIVGSGGGEVAEDGRIQDLYPLPGTLIADLIKALEDTDADFSVCQGGVHCALKGTFYLRLLARCDGMSCKVVDKSFLIGQSHPKLLITCPPLSLNKTLGIVELFRQKNPVFSCLKTGPILLEVTDVRVTKATGLKKMMEDHGWTMSELMAFGDDDNDCEMLKGAGMGVAMGNASPKAKAAAAYSTSDNKHDGVASFLEKTLLS